MTNHSKARLPARALREPDWLRLQAGRWVPLPGTELEALLHGKLRGIANANACDIQRNARTGPAELNGWNVPRDCYLRRRG